MKIKDLIIYDTDLLDTTMKEAQTILLSVPQWKLATTDLVTLNSQRKQLLKDTGRIELGRGILPQLMETFSDSRYIDSYNSIDEIAGLQELFYFFKSETHDQLTDQAILDKMKQGYENQCGGSIERLYDYMSEEEYDDEYFTSL